MWKLILRILKQILHQSRWELDVTKCRIDLRLVGYVWLSDVNWNTPSVKTVDEKWGLTEGVWVRLRYFPNTEYSGNDCEKWYREGLQFSFACGRLDGTFWFFTDFEQWILDEELMSERDLWNESWCIWMVKNAYFSNF